MNFDDALKIVESVCVQFQGTLQDHQTIQKALQTIRETKKEAETENEN